MGGSKTVIWRHVRVDPRSADMMDEVARLTPDLPTITPTQGSYNTSVAASAGTHSGGGAIDISVRNLTRAQEIELIRVMRRVGFAAWVRPELWRNGTRVWVRHIHGIAVGQPDLAASAARQVTALRNGRDGLAANGPDPHASLNLPVTTWEAYQASQRTSGGSGMKLSTRNGSDIINTNGSKPKTNSVGHQLRKGHLYPHRMVVALFSGSTRYNSLDGIASPGTETNPRPTAAKDPARKNNSWRYALQRIWRWVYWAYLRIVQVDERTDRIEAKLDALIEGLPDNAAQEARVQAAVAAALAEHDRRVVKVDVTVLSADDEDDPGDDDEEDQGAEDD